MPTAPECRAANEALLSGLQDPGRYKEAAGAVDDYTRMYMEEEGVIRKVLPPITIGNDELTPVLDHDFPTKIVHRETRAPAAVSVAFGQQPTAVTLYGDKYRVDFAQIMSVRGVKHVDQLRTYPYDLRQMFSDSCSRQLLAAEDSRAIYAANAMMVGADTPVSFNQNTVMWKTLYGGVDRLTWKATRQIMPAAPGRIETQLALLNTITIKEFEGWGRDEMGGDLSEEILRDGFVKTKLSGVDIIASNKLHIIPTDSAFLFGGPSYLGKFYELNPPVMHVKSEMGVISFCQYETIGMAWANPNAVARVDYA